MKDKLEAIRQKCIEANPEIVELKFGCAVTVSDDGEDYIVIDTEPVVDLNEDGKRYVLWNGQMTEYFRIVGRSIRLADVLLAIQHLPGHKRPGDWVIDVGGQFWHIRAQNDEGLWDCQPKSCRWSCRQDDLEKQSPETVDFIANVLGV